MARLAVNPTRMELSRLKKRLTTSIRGHKLLKDKRDELMRQFLDIVRDNKKLRKSVEEAIMNAHRHFAIASAVIEDEVMAEALMLPKQEVYLEADTKNVMSVDVPVFEFKTKSSDTSDIYPYGFAYTSGDLDGAVKELSGILPDLLKLAQMEKSAQLLAQEIEKTRRRVNALEYVMIPQLQETIKYITMKLDETERSSLARLMKVKDMMIQENIEAKRQAQ